MNKKKPTLVEELSNYYYNDKDSDKVSQMGKQPSFKEGIVDDDEKSNFDQFNGKSTTNSTNDSNGPKRVDFIGFDNPYEAYLTAQIQECNALLPVLDQHISFLEDGEDIDLVLESLEHSIYRVKKQTYTNVEEWEKLLDFLPEEKIKEIEHNPLGHGDFLLKELIWIRKYEDKWMKR